MAGAEGDGRGPGAGGGGSSGDGDAAGRRNSDRSTGSRELPESARCPFCGEEDTEQFAAFGSALSTSQYYCRTCRTVFEFMKWRRRTE